jgi:hypothetical protein
MEFLEKNNCYFNIDTLIDNAVKEGNFKIINYFDKKYPHNNIFEKAIISSLRYACIYNKYSKIKKLHKNGINIDYIILYNYIKKNLYIIDYYNYKKLITYLCKTYNQYNILNRLYNYYNKAYIIISYSVQLFVIKTNKYNLNRFKISYISGF